MRKKKKYEPRTIKLLLSESIRSLGRVGDVVDVSPGHARNFLVPQGLAVQPTPANVARVEERKKEIERLEKAKREQQKQLIGKLAGTEVTLERRANERGHLFGSVGATDIAHALNQQGFEVEPENVWLPGKLDRIERYEVTVAFADEADLKTEIKLYVAPDAESKSAMDAYAADQARNKAADAEAEAAGE